MTWWLSQMKVVLLQQARQHTNGSHHFYMSPPGQHRWTESVGPLVGPKRELIRTPKWIGPAQLVAGAWKERPNLWTRQTHPWHWMQKKKEENFCLVRAGQFSQEQLTSGRSRDSKHSHVWYLHSCVFLQALLKYDSQWCVHASDICICASFAWNLITVLSWNAH